MDIGIADGVHAYGDDAVPLLADTQGFRGALLLVDEVTGHVIIEAIWRGPPDLAASRGDVRADLAESAGWVIRALEEYGLVPNSARKA